MPTAVIFDLDGTLLDTLEDLADSANEALAAFAFSSHATDAYKVFVGDGMTVLMERILPAANRDEETIAALRAAYEAAYRRRWKDKSQPYAGIEVLLKSLTARGIPMAVLSNKPQSYTEMCMAHFFGDYHFPVVLGQREGVPRKPHPAGAWEIASILGVQSRDVLFVGDTATDMETAVSAGMIPAGALWGFRSKGELEEHGARYLVASPQEIEDFFH